MTATWENPPPRPDSERAVLSSMLRDNGCISDILEVVSADDFLGYNPEVFRAIAGLHDAGRPADLVTLADELHRLGSVEAVGGYAYLARLWDECATAANAVHYARLVREASLRRRLLGVAEEIRRDVEGGTGGADELLAGAERRILELSLLGAGGAAVPMPDVVAEWSDRFDARAAADSTERGIATGWLDLDRITAGLQDSDLVIVAARPSIGKTGFAMELVRRVASAGAPVFVASLEQSRVELAERLVAAQSGVNSHNLRTGRLSPGELPRVAAAADELRQLPLFIDDWAYQPMVRIAANARRLKIRCGIRMVVVDYLQLIHPEDTRVPRHEQVAAISRRLKHLARELKIPVVALAQVSRAAEDRHDRKPRLSDLRESGGIEADADVVLLMSRSADNESVLEIDVAKHRNGPTGDVRLFFRRECMRFEDYDDHPRIP